jgi:hypothetical protein
MTNLLDYIAENKEGVLHAITAVIAAASAIAALTPTPRDNWLLRKVAALVDFLALNIGKAKDK